VADLTDLAKVKAWMGLGSPEVGAHTIPAAGPYTVTVSKAAAWQGDAGVLFSATGVPLLKVAGAPNAGQFSAAMGVYTFNITDANKAVRIAYQTFNVDDNLLARLITSASAFIAAFLDRTILTASYVEYRDGPGGYTLSLLNYPVTAVSALEINGVAMTLATGTVNYGYQFSDRQIVMRGYKFTRGIRNVQVSYTAGYATVPLDIEQACLELVAYKYRSRDWVGQASKIVGSENVSFITKEIPENALGTLNRWSRVAAI